MRVRFPLGLPYYIGNGLIFLIKPFFIFIIEDMEYNKSKFYIILLVIRGLYIIRMGENHEIRRIIKKYK